MIKLKGVAYSNGNIEFSRAENAWAFQRMDSEMKAGQEKRIVMKPEAAPLEIRAASSASDGSLTWLDEFRNLANTADAIYLQKQGSVIRFRQAVHDLGKDRLLVTLSTQEEVNSFAEERWGRIAYFYAHRVDGFRFKMLKMIAMRPEEDRREQLVEIKSRQHVYESDPIPSITFDATGGDAVVEVIEWRGSVNEGAKGRFSYDNYQVSLSVKAVKQPFSFGIEYRKEFKNHAYIFESGEITKMLKKISRRTPAGTELPEDSEEK